MSAVNGHPEDKPKIKRRRTHNLKISIMFKVVECSVFIVIFQSSCRNSLVSYRSLVTGSANPNFWAMFWDTAPAHEADHMTGGIRTRADQNAGGRQTSQSKAKATPTRSFYTCKHTHHFGCVRLSIRSRKSNKNNPKAMVH